MDEIDAIGGRRFSEGTSADREIQRTLMELLNQLDGFDQLGKVCLGYKSILEVSHITGCGDRFFSLINSCGDRCVGKTLNSKI
jgi:hypothetical protein